MPRPSLVFPNYGDHAYAKVAMDAESVAWARENIDRVEDTLLRQLLWSSLWNMTRDAQLKAQDFLDLVNTKVVREPDITVVESVLGQASLALTRLLPDAVTGGRSRLFNVPSTRSLAGARSFRPC